MTLDTQHVLALVAIACAGGSIVILVRHLIAPSRAERPTRAWLLVAIGPLSLSAAFTGNAANHEVMKQRRFCGGCHATAPMTTDAADPASETLARRHSRNGWVGETSCSACHADYPMLDDVVTRVSALEHAFAEYTQDWQGPGHARPHLAGQFPNANCLRCHSRIQSGGPLEHRVHGDVIESGAVACASIGCHGPAHVAGATVFQRLDAAGTPP